VERDAGRERTVGRVVVEQQYQLFEQAAASIRQEGFDQVVEISDAEMEQVKIEIVFRPPAKKPAAPARPAHRPNVAPAAPSQVTTPGPAPAASRPISGAARPWPAAQPERLQPPAATPAPATASPSPAAFPNGGVAPKPPAGPGQAGSES